PDDPQRLAVLAEAILRNAAGLARPGGRVVFSVCSVLRGECEDLAARVLDVLEPVPFDAPELSAALSATGVGHGATAFRLLPRRHGTDGFFVGSFVRRSLDGRG